MLNTYSILVASRLEAIARFEAVRVVLLHQCVLTLEEINALVPVGGDDTGLDDYAQALADAQAGPRGEPGDIGGYCAPVLPHVGPCSAQHSTCTGRTVVYLERFAAAPEEYAHRWGVIVARTEPLGDCPRDKAILFALSPEFEDRWAGALAKEWRDVFPPECKYKSMDDYFGISQSNSPAPEAPVVQQTLDYVVE